MSKLKEGGAAHKNPAEAAEKRREARLTLREREQIVVEGMVMGWPRQEIWTKAGFSGRYDSARFSQMLLRPKIKDAILARQREVAERNNITMDEVVKKLRDAYDLAEKLQQPSAMVSSAEKLAKVAGLIDSRNNFQAHQMPQPPADPSLRAVHDKRMERIAGLGQGKSSGGMAQPDLAKTKPEGTA